MSDTAILNDTIGSYYRARVWVMILSVVAMIMGVGSGTRIGRYAKRLSGGWL